MFFSYALRLRRTQYGTAYELTAYSYMPTRTITDACIHYFSRRPRSRQLPQKTRVHAPRSSCVPTRVKFDRAFTLSRIFHATPLYIFMYTCVCVCTLLIRVGMTRCTSRAVRVLCPSKECRRVVARARSRRRRSVHAGAVSWRFSVYSIHIHTHTPYTYIK